MMLEMMVGAFGIGIAVSIPVGAFTVAASKRAISSGFRSAMVFTFGSLLGDAFYALLAYLGLATLLSTNETLRLLLWIMGGAWLCWLGWDALRTRLDSSSLEGLIQQETVRKGFAAGLGVTLFNPVTIVGWIALASSFFAGWQEGWLPLYPFGLLVIIAMLLGTFLYFVIFLGFLSRVRRYISPRILMTSSIVAGTLLIFFGLSAWWSAASTLLAS